MWSHFPSFDLPTCRLGKHGKLRSRGAIFEMKILQWNFYIKDVPRPSHVASCALERPVFPSFHRLTMVRVVAAPTSPEEVIAESYPTLSDVATSPTPPSDVSEVLGPLTCGDIQGVVM